jgi:hypothetical protein
VYILYNILLDVEWIPRDENSYADYLSQIFDFDDWGVSKNIFNYFDTLASVKMTRCGILCTGIMHLKDKKIALKIPKS